MFARNQCTCIAMLLRKGKTSIVYLKSIVLRFAIQMPEMFENHIVNSKKSEVSPILWLANFE